MEHQSAVYLDALGANIALSAKMKQELDTLGYTVVHHLADPAWLAAMRELIDALVESEGDNRPWNTIRRRPRRVLPIW